MEGEGCCGGDPEEGCVAPGHCHAGQRQAQRPPGALSLRLLLTSLLYNLRMVAKGWLCAA